MGLSNAERQARWRARHPRVDKPVEAVDLSAERQKLEAEFVERRRKLEAEVEALKRRLATSGAGRKGFRITKAEQRTVRKALHSDRVSDPQEKALRDRASAIFNSLPIEVIDEKQVAAEAAKDMRDAEAWARGKAAYEKRRERGKQGWAKAQANKAAKAAAAAEAAKKPVT